jgi:polyphosphate kinase
VTGLSEADVYPVDRLVDLVALKEIAALDIPELKYPPIKQRSQFSKDRSIFEQMREHDRLLLFPRDNFSSTVERFIAEAAADDDVVSIKITLYRTDRGSKIVQALARAREAGKDAFALVELKASFDERRNVEWARSLESAGVHVVYSPANFKVHAKTALVVRSEPDGVKRYAYLGTGNLNAATARAYTDIGLLTTDPDLAEEVNAVFNVLTGYSAGAHFKHLLVSPFNMRRRFIELVDREIAHARAGRPSHDQCAVSRFTGRRAHRDGNTRDLLATPRAGRRIREHHGGEQAGAALAARTHVLFPQPWRARVLHWLGGLAAAQPLKACGGRDPYP